MIQVWQASLADGYQLAIAGYCLYILRAGIRTKRRQAKIFALPDLGYASGVDPFGWKLRQQAGRGNQSFRETLRFR